MAKIIAAVNQKGGVGKSTTALSIGAGLALRGKRVLFIDMDAQGNMSSTLRADTSKPGALEVITNKATVEQVIQHTEGGDIVSSSPNLFLADRMLQEAAREYRLSEALEAVKDKYDYIIIDTPPALSVLTTNALTAAEEAIVPAQADVYSLEGISQLNETIKVVRKHCNPRLKVKGIVITRYSSRAILSRDIAEVLKRTAADLDTKVFNTMIRECIAIKECQAMRQNIFAYAPKSNASADYNDLIDEIMEAN